MILSGKTALVTGGSRGIGKQIALTLAREGANIAFTGSKMSDAAQATRDEIAALGVKVAFFASDAADFEAAHQIVDAVVKEFGSLDILVNNAGITRDTLLMRMTEEQWDRVIEVNLKSVFNFTHAATPIMMRQRSGSIINLSSVVGINGNAGQANYAASKAGIIAFTKSVAKELGSRGVRANVIAPGFILTDMTKDLPEETLKSFVSMIPMRRAGDPEEVAKVALFLASDLASYVSGQVIQVNGAMA